MTKKYVFPLSFFFVLLALLLWLSPVVGQKGKPAVIAFYNLENLFDTIDTPDVLDSEFTPESKKAWNSKRYWLKIENMADVISKLGSHENVSGPAIIGLCEMENRTVLEDLVKSPRLSHLKYEIVHYNSPDKRGIDVAMLYQPTFFKPTDSRSVALIINDEEGNRVYSRDMLQVSGNFNGERMHVIVNHWPARRGGEETSSEFRIDAAKLARSLVDSIMAIEKNAKIIVMGDLNDDPTNESVQKHLNAGSDQQNLQLGQLFNAMASLYNQGIGTLAYRDKWNLFDQIILSKPFVTDSKKGYTYISSRVYNESFLAQPEGRYKGYPFRTYVGNNYHGGYSDHFPSYILIGQKSKSRKK
jgi:hypothetical protein